MKVRYTATALAEIEDILTYIAKDNRSAALRVSVTILSTIDRVAEFFHTSQWKVMYRKLGPRLFSLIVISFSSVLLKTFSLSETFVTQRVSDRSFNALARMEHRLDAGVTIAIPLDLQMEALMPIILWLLGVPVVVIIALLLTHVI